MNDLKIELEYEGKKYTLEYNKAAVKLLEANNFNLDTFMKKPMTNIEMVFQGAFYKNHQDVPVDTVMEIFNHCGDKQQLIAVITKMISDTYESLLGDAEENDPKKVMWKTVDLTPKKEN